MTYDELKSVDLLEPYDQAFDAHQVKTNKDWDKLVVEYTEHNLLSGLCILMRKLFTMIATENWSLASIYANDIENWLYILDDTEFKYNGSMCESDILDYYKKVGKKLKIMKEYIINEETENIRLDKVVTLFNQEISRSMIQKLLEEDKIKVNEKIQKASYKTKVGDKIEIEVIMPKGINRK